MIRPLAMDPRAEARERVGGRYDVRVLEPSPPAVPAAPWFADDPVDGGEVVPLDRPGTRSWVSLAAEDPSLVDFCQARWLGPWPRLVGVPAGFVDGRLILQAVAERVVAPARFAVVAKIGLRWVRGGFGTPFFGDDRQVRVAGGQLLADDSPLPLAGLTLEDAAALAGVAGIAWHGVYPPGPSSLLPPATPIDVPDGVLPSVADWFGFTTSVLEQVRSDLGVASTTRVQLWPEHFDIAISVGDASVGGSPGDEGHDEPYLYVSTGRRVNEPWGRSLPYAALLDAEDQRATALTFLRSSLAAG